MRPCARLGCLVVGAPRSYTGEADAVRAGRPVPPRRPLPVSPLHRVLGMQEADIPRKEKRGWEMRGFPHLPCYHYFFFNLSISGLLQNFLNFFGMMRRKISTVSNFVPHSTHFLRRTTIPSSSSRVEYTALSAPHLGHILAAFSVVSGI